MDTLNKALSKGIPNELVLPISFFDVINISSNKERTKQILMKALNDYNRQLAAVTGKSYKFLYTNRQVQVNTNLNDLSKYISISEGFLEQMLVMCLNIDDLHRVISRNGIPAAKLYTPEKAAARMQRLAKVKKESELKKGFPFLHKTYTDIIQIKSQLDRLKQQSVQHYLEFLKSDGLEQADIAMIDSIQSFSDFMTYMQETINITISRKEELSAMAKEHTIDSRVFGINSSKKLELYLADTYAICAAQPTSDIATKQKCAYYLSAYMFENEDQLDDGMYVERLTTNYNGQKTTRITKHSVYEKFRQLLIDNPQLFNVNFDQHIFKGMSIDEIDKLMADYLESLKLKWDIIPDGVVITPPEESTEKEMRTFSRTNCSNVVGRSPKELFYEKKAFFDSTEPLLRVMGKDTFDGYIGYIYPNGQVILDKYYENTESRRLAQDVAIYSMGIDDFYRLSQLSKSEIIRDRLCKRFYHRGDWQSRVTNQISGGPQKDINQKINILRQLSTASTATQQ